jgi:hypothetical protein
MEYDDLKRNFTKIKSSIDKSIFARDTLIEKINNNELLLEDYKDKRTHANLADIYLRSRAAEILKTTLETISGMVTDLLQQMYGSDYEFCFVYNERAQEKGERVGFNITPTITSNLNGIRNTTSIKNSRGGGLIEVVSVLLRFAVLKYFNYNGIIILDETWVSVSADEKMVNLIKFLTHYIEECDIQLLFITHRAEMFGKDANNIIQVKKNDGIAKVRQINYDDILKEMVTV